MASRIDHKYAHRRYSGGDLGAATRLTQLMLAATMAACSGSVTSVAPSEQPRIPTPAAPTTAGWTVAIRTTAVTGPPFCIYTPSVGSVFQGDYDVFFHTDTVSFVPPDPYDWNTFVGSFDGSAFMAVNLPENPGYGTCTHYLEGSDLAGRFSADLNAFTAVEHWYFTLDSGDVKTVTFEWSADRRNVSAKSIAGRENRDEDHLRPNHGRKSTSAFRMVAL
jgi:hypothetical protein